jgi:hypothetical protein
MALEVGMKRRSGMNVTVPEIETDLSRIRKLSQGHDDENWEFRSWLKQRAPDNIDHIVKALGQKCFALIDCAVRKLLPVITNGIQEKRASHHRESAWAIDKSIRETIYVRRPGESAVPDAEREALFHLRDQTGGLPVVSSPRATTLYTPTD